MEGMILLQIRYSEDIIVVLGLLKKLFIKLQNK